MTAALNVDAWPDVHDALRRGEPVTIVVDGERRWFDEHSRWPAALVPPAVFRDLPETCETCGGKGANWCTRPSRHAGPCDVPTSTAGQVHACRECVGGVPLVEFVARCRLCGGTGKDALMVALNSVGAVAVERCGPCDNGRVRLARGTVQVLPVADHYLQGGKSFVLVTGVRAVLIDGPGPMLDITDTLLTLPKVGQFVAVLTPETTP